MPSISLGMRDEEGVSGSRGGRITDIMEGPANIYLIDGNSYVYRAYHAIRGLSNSRGFPTNAIYGFINTLLKIIREKEPDALVVSFDSPLPTDRHRVYEEYKAQRPPAPDDLVLQMPYIKKIIEAFGIVICEVPGYEADDVLATLAVKAASQGIDAYIVSGDKDMLQVLDGHIWIYDPVKDRVISRADVLERFGVPPERIPEIMALTGDTADNIPGVKGIGEKTACEILREHTIEEILDRPELIKRERLRRLVAENRESIIVSLTLARVDREVPVEIDVRGCMRREPDWQELLRIFSELEFGTFLKLIPPQPVSGEYETVLESGRLERLLNEIRGLFAFDVAFSGKTSGRAVLVGIAFSPEKGKGYYVPVSHRDGPEVSAALDAFRAVYENGSISKAGHDLKGQILVLRKSGIDVRGDLYDTMVASYLLNPNRQGHDLQEVVLEHLSLRIRTLKEVLGKRSSLADVPVDEAAGFSASNAAVVLELEDVLFRKLKDDGLEKVYSEIEMPLIKVLADMEETGIKVDTSLLQELSKELERELAALQTRIYFLAGEEFNINSPKQLSSVLFDSLGLRPRRKTKTGYSTEVGVLEELALEHELPGEILNWRTLSKLKSTYVDVLPRLVNPETGRIHTSFNQTVTATGRLSSSDPNLQNIPVRGEWGTRIRKAFVAEEGFVLLSADYSQIELRILAHLSGDEGLIDAFRSGVDIHTRTAAELFGVSGDEVTHEMRRVAKTVNFGVVYGISAFGLSGAIGSTREDARVYIEQYFEKHPGVRRYVKQVVEDAARVGHVRTLFGRKREIPELRSRNAQKRALGERLAMNTPIQGTAADIIKKAMVNISSRLKTGGLRSRMLLQVHDELVLEVKEEELEPATDLVRHEMENAADLSVPMRVEIGCGRNWAEAHS
ncbi:MAG: DNA polymerase I [Nitrospirae bacterium]|nr:DNA polymerase I [Nitrospirota bacterium]